MAGNDIILTRCLWVPGGSIIRPMGMTELIVNGLKFLAAASIVLDQPTSLYKRSGHSFKCRFTLSILYKGVYIQLGKEYHSNFIISIDILFPCCVFYKDTLPYNGCTIMLMKKVEALFV